MEQEKIGKFIGAVVFASIALAALFGIDMFRMHRNEEYVPIKCKKGYGANANGWDDRKNDSRGRGEGEAVFS